MARDWSREPYRKLLLRPSREFLLLDALAQGIGYVLSREADDDGYLPFATSFDDGLKKLWKIINVPPRQRSIVVRCLEDLMADGMVRHVGDRLFVKNLRDINERREWGSKGASPKVGSKTNPRPADAEPTPSEPPADRERTVSEPPANHRRTIGEQSKHTQVPETIQGDPPSRARSQVGREVGRKVDQDPRERRHLAPAPEDHPVTLLIAANAALVHGTPPSRLAAGVITLAGTRPIGEQVEATEIALEAVMRKLSSSGLDDAAEYFSRCIANLFRGGLEAERAKRAQQATNNNDDVFELLREQPGGHS